MATTAMMISPEYIQTGVRFIELIFACAIAVAGSSRSSISDPQFIHFDITFFPAGKIGMYQMCM
jgi:hypothetical protein